MGLRDRHTSARVMRLAGDGSGRLDLLHDGEVESA
jgi:hypothetical protein